MNRNHFWKLVLIVGAVIWSLSQMYPPTNRDLVQYFSERGVRHDDTYKKIIASAQELQKAKPDLAYENLLEAIGTNSIVRYFPFFNATNQTQPATYILNRLQREAAGKFKKGIDLAGGTSFVVRLGTNELETVSTNQAAGGTNEVKKVRDNKAAVSQAVEVLRKRVDRFGVAEPIIQPQGEDRIMIQLPGLSHSQMKIALDTIKKAAYLEFRLVHENSDNELSDGRIPPGYQVMSTSRTSPKTGEKIIQKYLVRKKPELVGGIKHAGVTRDNMGRPEILFTFNDAAAKTFFKVTTDNIGRQLAIILDGELQTAPNIQSAISNNGRITGDYTEQEAFGLANVLENPLENPLIIESSSEVDPTLGQDTIDSGIRAALYGVIAVVIFMLVYYMFSGVVATLALMLNIVILLGVMCSVGTTLTLPGIAGIVLTIGMAVDANVLIFERVREELAAGKSLRGAIVAGYDKAFGTIFDSNLTTLISSVILIFMGTGPVKGFGVTLTIGITVSMFTALVVTRLIFDFLIAKNLIKSMRMLHLVPTHAKFDFMRWAAPAFVASWLLIVIGNGYGLIGRGSDVLGVEFAGGETITLNLDQQRKPDVDKLREVAEKISGGGVMVSYQRNVGEGTSNLRVTVRSLGKDTSKENIADKVIGELKARFPDAKFNVSGRDIVGPTMGQEIMQAAVVATLLALFGILVYVAFRYEFSFAVGAVIAIVHDILMTLGCYFLSGKELNATTVAAMLTIIGFSINDTIVIFDRIREDLKLGVRGTFREIMNQAINQTLSRTFITSGTVFLATLSLYIFGGGAINDFAFTFMIGILTGTYSSIYMASYLVLRWHKGERPKIGASQQITTEAGIVPDRV